MNVTLNSNINNQNFNGKKCILKRNTSREAVSRMYYLKKIKAENEWIAKAEQTPNLEQWYSGERNSLNSRQYNSAVCSCIGKFAKMAYYKTMSILPLLGW